MPLINGIEATRQIVRRSPTVRVLILSMHANEAYIIQALKAGAKGTCSRIQRTPIWFALWRRSPPESRSSARRSQR